VGKNILNPKPIPSLGGHYGSQMERKKEARVLRK